MIELDESADDEQPKKGIHATEEIAAEPDAPASEQPSA